MSTDMPGKVDDRAVELLSEPPDIFDDVTDPAAVLDEEFAKFKIPTSLLKHMRHHSTVSICVGCQDDGTLETMMICSRCKIAVYCSKECQKRNWVVHKKECRQSTTGISFKLVHTFLSDPFNVRLLKQLFITLVGLDKAYALTNAYIVRCDLSIEPSMNIVSDLATGRSKLFDYPNGVEGMLRIRRARPLDLTTSIDLGRAKIWKNGIVKEARRRLYNAVHDIEAKYTRIIGLVDFCMDGTDQVITVPLPIDDDELDIARVCSVTIPETAYRPPEATWLSLMEGLSLFMINIRIEDDEKNRMRMRVHIPQKRLDKYVGIDFSRYKDEVGLLPPKDKIPIRCVRLRMQDSHRTDALNQFK